MYISFKNNIIASTYWAIITLSLLFTIGCNSENKSEGTISGKIELAENLMHSGDYKTAIDLCTEIITLDSESSSNYQLRAKCYENMYLKDTNQKILIKNIINDYKKAISINPNTENYLARAEFNCYTLKNYNAVLDDFDFAMRSRYSDTDRILEHRGFFYFNVLKDSALAFNDFRRIINEFNSNKTVHLTFAICLSRCGRHKEALQNYKLYLQKQHQEYVPDIEKYIGLCYLRMNDYYTALHFFNNVIEKSVYEKPDAIVRFNVPSKFNITYHYMNDLEFHIYRGYCLYKLGHQEVGKKEMKEFGYYSPKQIVLEDSFSNHVKNVREWKSGWGNKPNIEINASGPRPSEFFEIFPEAPRTQFEKSSEFSAKWPNN